MLQGVADLRQYAAKMSKNVADPLNAFADKIESEIDELEAGHQLALLAAVDNRYEFPKDSNGNRLNFGDLITNDTIDVSYEVVGVGVDDIGRDVVYACDESGMFVACYPSEYHLVVEPTVEDSIRLLIMGELDNAVNAWARGTKYYVSVDKIKKLAETLERK